MASSLNVNHGNFWRSLPQWTAIVREWFTGEDWVRAVSYCSAAMALSLTTTVLLVQVSYAQRRFINALSEKNIEEFYQALWHFLCIIIAAVFLSTLQPYVESHLVLAWRKHLTAVLCKAFFEKHTYYQVVHTEGIDNPDQRIQQDAASFVRTSTAVGLKLTQTLFNCAAFGGVLWSISPMLVGVIFVYTSIGTWLTASVFGKRLMSLKFTVLKQEANMRYALVRVREHSESISFYNGQASEAACVESRFEAVVHTVVKAIRLTALLNMWRNVYDYATILVPPVVIAPRYFRGEIQFGVVTQADYAFAKIVTGFSLVILQLDSISTLAAETDRLYELFAVLKLVPPPAKAPVAIISSLLSLWLWPFRRASKVKGADEETLPLTAKTPPGATASASVEGEPCSTILRTVLEDSAMLLVVRNLCARVPTPEGKSKATEAGPGRPPYTIADALSLSVEAGQSVLIMGPSGCGKSSLLRVIAGLWTQGTGSIECVPQQACCFLPQKPYMPLGSLRQQLIFPQCEDGPQAVESDVALKQLAADVRLYKLADKEVDLDATSSWAEVFSVGEQQRVAFARLLRMKPSIAFLDEATSALDVETERHLYELMRSRCRGYVSVGHRPQLVEFHTHILRWQSPGQWKLSRTQ